MKKSFSFVLVALLILLGAAKSNVVLAQSNQFSWSHYGNMDQYVPLCVDESGKPVEVMVNTWFHCVCHWINGQQTYMNMRWRGTFTYNNVEYEINDMVFYGKKEVADWWDPAYYTVRFNSNVKGSDGSHLVASGILTMYDPSWNEVWTIEYDKIVSK